MQQFGRNFYLWVCARHLQGSAIRQAAADDPDDLAGRHAGFFREPDNLIWWSIAENSLVHDQPF